MKEYTEDFERARKLWPGVKRGCDTELAYLKSKHKDWIKVIPLMYPAIEQQIKRRQSKIQTTPQPFIPPWKNFKTWLCNRCWEETEGSEVDPAIESRKRAKEEEQEKQKARDMYGKYFREKTTTELADILKSDNSFHKYYHWLIKEIIAERGKQCST